MTPRDKVAAWHASASGRLLSGALLEQIDLDDLLGSLYVPAEAVAQALRCFEVLIDVSESDAQTVMPIRAVPLPSSETLDTERPDPSRLQEGWDEGHPPGLYLYKREILIRMHVEEEYRHPLDSPSCRPRSGSLLCYYRVFRDLEEIREGWEYNRVVLLEYYPPELISEPRTRSA